MTQEELEMQELLQKVAEIEKQNGNAVTYSERREVYQSAIRKYGAEAQTWMAVEEMSELLKELSKSKRGKHDTGAIADEIADVTIMLEQLRIIFDCNDMVCERMDYKIERLRQRIKEP